MGFLSEYTNAADIRRAVKTKAGAFVPEWRFTEDDPDGGTAIALAFADMFGETAERLERVPYKYFLNFLNMLETRIRSVSPATGLAHILLSDNATLGRRIPEGTQMYADVDIGNSDTQRVIYETSHEITAIPSKLLKMFGVDPRHDVINELLPDERETKIFFPDKENDLQAHRFTIWHSDVLRLNNPAKITVKLESAGTRYDGGNNTERLADPGFTTWSYVRNGVSEPITRTYANDGSVTLELDGIRPSPGEEVPFTVPPLDMQPHIICQMHPEGLEAGITTDGITIGSAYLYPEKNGVHITPDLVYYNDIALKPFNPGYLFGKAPGRYDNMLISCDEVLSKRGAKISVDFVMHTVIRETGAAPDGPVYQWDGRYVIERAEGQIVTPDNMFINEVVWEYWNDVGWAHLEVESANLNIFKSDEQIRHEKIIFKCPDDITGSYQNSIWGLWIRARVIDIENPFSHYGRWQLPFAESISLDYDYESKLRGAETIKIENNAESVMLSSGETGAGVSLFRPLKYSEHALYLAFDKIPQGLPASIYIGLRGTGGRSRTLSFERLVMSASGDTAFRACKAIDGSGGLMDSGVISMFVPGDMVLDSIFGTEAYWLRIVDADSRYAENDDSAVLERVELNAVEIVQKQTVTGLLYDTELFDSGKTITLPERPVLGCEVFVDEIGSITPDDRDDVSGVEFVYDNDGTVTHAWVKWDVVASLAHEGPESRAVSIDAHQGILRFGNGVSGRVPPDGDSNIRINYSYGGGSLGNIPAGAIEGLSSGIQTVTSVTNITPTGGGNDSENIHTLERIGPARLRHRGRAVTLDDFENLAQEEFPEIAAAKAFAGLDSKGSPASSYITVVLLMRDSISRDQIMKVCKNVYNFLASRAHCELVTAGRLSVIPALMMTVNVIVEAVAEDITRAAVTERAIMDALARQLSGDSQPKIGYLPTKNDVINCLRGIPNLSYVDRVSLEGQYFDGGKSILTLIDKPEQFPFACTQNGTHIVRF